MNDTNDPSSENEAQKKAVERRKRRQTLGSQGILLIEDELPDRGAIRKHLEREFGSNSVQALGSMEAVICHLAKLGEDDLPPSVIILDLFLYSRTAGDEPDVVLEQLMVKNFAVPLATKQASGGVEEEPRDKVVLGRLGVLASLVDVVKAYEQKPRPNLILYTQLFKYCKRYDRSFGYTVYEVAHEEGSEPEVKEAYSNIEYRRGEKHKEILNALSAGIGERLKGIECASRVALNTVEKPYNHLQRTNDKEFLAEEGQALMNLADMVETLLSKANA